jgi:hypothetical protein
MMIFPPLSIVERVRDAKVETRGGIASEPPNRSQRPLQADLKTHERTTGVRWEPGLWAARQAYPEPRVGCLIAN